MKRFILVISLVISSMMIAGCGKKPGDEFIGTWDYYFDNNTTPSKRLVIVKNNNLYKGTLKSIHRGKIKTNYSFDIVFKDGKAIGTYLGKEIVLLDDKITMIVPIHFNDSMTNLFKKNLELSSGGK